MRSWPIVLVAILFWLPGSAFAETITLHLGASETSLDSEFPSVQVDVGPPSSGVSQATVQVANLTDGRSRKSDTPRVTLVAAATGDVRDSGPQRALRIQAEVLLGSGPRSSPKRYSVTLTADVPVSRRAIEVVPVRLVGVHLDATGNPTGQRFDIQMLARVE